MFNQGEEVLCIEATEDGSIEPGKIYLVSSVFSALNGETHKKHAGCPELGVDLVGHARKPDCYCVCHFRRLDDPAIDIFRKMTADIDVPAMIWGK